MKNKIKRGFTIVELVIVIAVIGVLSAILIPTFSGLLKSAKEAADTQMVRNLNTALEVDAITNGKHETAHDAIRVANESGYSVEKLTPTASGCDIVWDRKSDRFVIFSGNKLKFYDETTPPSDKKSDMWKIYSDVNEAQKETQYSVYLSENATGSVAVTNIGIDVGNNLDISEVRYIGSNNAEVVIRTNSAKTTLGINDPSGKAINFYGKVGKICGLDENGAIDTTKGAVVAMNSLHIDKGAVVSYLKIKNGHIENKGKIDLIYATSQNVKITNTGDIDHAHANSKNDIEAFIENGSIGVAFDYNNNIEQNSNMNVYHHVNNYDGLGKTDGKGTSYNPDEDGNAIIQKAEEKEKAPKGSQENPYTLSEFNSLTKASGDIYLTINLNLSNAAKYTIGNYDLGDCLKFESKTSKGDSFIDEFGDVYYYSTTKNGKDLYKTKKDAINLHIVGELNAISYNDSSFTSFRGLNFILPESSTITFEKDMTFNGYFNLSGSYIYLYDSYDGVKSINNDNGSANSFCSTDTLPAGTILTTYIKDGENYILSSYTAESAVRLDSLYADSKGNKYTNRFNPNTEWGQDDIALHLNTINMNGCTINGGWYANGSLPRNVTIDGVKWNTVKGAGINEMYYNNSNPIWWKNGNTMLTIKNSTFDIARPIKVTEGGWNKIYQYSPATVGLNIQNNTFNMHAGNIVGTTGENNNNKNAIFYLTETFSSCRITNNVIKAVNDDSLVSNPTLIAVSGNPTLFDGCSFYVQDNTWNGVDGSLLSFKETINVWKSPNTAEWDAKITNFVNNKNVSGNNLKTNN